MLLFLSGEDLEVIHAPLRLGDIKHSYANIAKAKKLLSYSPEFNLEQGLQALLKENSVLKPSK
jgi:UDP-N-acetylglucosamine 4-epimerase